MFGILIGFIAMIFLSCIPVLGPILAGFIAGIIINAGTGRGALAGFLSGILGALALAIIVTAGSSYLGWLFHIPIISFILGSSLGVLIILGGLYFGFLGFVGGAIGGAIRTGKKTTIESPVQVNVKQDNTGKNKEEKQESVSLSTEIEKLSDLHTRGLLTDEEFSRAKARLLTK